MGTASSFFPRHRIVFVSYVKFRVPRLQFDSFRKDLLESVVELRNQIGMGLSELEGAIRVSAFKVIWNWLTWLI